MSYTVPVLSSSLIEAAVAGSTEVAHRPDCGVHIGLVAPQPRVAELVVVPEVHQPGAVAISDLADRLIEQQDPRQDQPPAGQPPGQVGEAKHDHVGPARAQHPDHAIEAGQQLR